MMETTTTAIEALPVTITLPSGEVLVLPTSSSSCKCKKACRGCR